MLEDVTPLMRKVPELVTSPRSCPPQLSSSDVTCLSPALPQQRGSRYPAITVAPVRSLSNEESGGLTVQQSRHRGSGEGAGGSMASHPRYHAAVDDTAGMSRRTGDEVQCTFCGRILCNKYVLKVHIRDIHSPRSSHQCPHCRRSYSTLNSLRVHISTLHNRPSPHLPTEKRAAPLTPQQGGYYSSSHSNSPQQFFDNLLGQPQSMASNLDTSEHEFLDPNSQI